MNENDINRVLFITLNSLSEIGTSKVSMWSTLNRYAYPPYFSFKFKDGDQARYDKLQYIIVEFKGQFRWNMKRHDNSASSYIIAPLNYLDNLISADRDSVKDFLTQEMTPTKYEEMIDAIIIEIPALANHIKKSMEVL